MMNNMRYFFVSYNFKRSHNQFGFGRTIWCQDGMLSLIDFETYVEQVNAFESVVVISFQELTKEDYEALRLTA